MKTQFILTADTGDMKVTLTIKQGGRILWTKRYGSVTEACMALLNGIGKVTEGSREDA